MEEEIWKSVIGYEGYYSVSSLGRLRGETREINCKDRRHSYIRPQYIKKVCLCSNKRYLNADLYKNGKVKRIGVHQLVARAFIGKQKKRMEVCHINGISTDNRLCNLKYGSHSDNMRDAFNQGKMPQGDSHPSAKLNTEQVKEIYLSTLPYKDLINKYGVSKNTIVCIKNRKIRKGATEEIKYLKSNKIKE